MDEIKATTLGSINKELYFNKKVSISFDTVEYDPTADYKVMIQIEPPVIVNLIDSMIVNHNNFDLLLAWHPKILSTCSNSELFPFGDCWINELDRRIHKKTKNLSIIASHKNTAEGHKLRHEIIKANITDMDIFGRAYNPIDNKITALKDYRFSLIIENDNIDNNVTEKIVDCLVTGTIPLYWGCSNIGDYFNTKGFIEFKNLQELIELLPKLSKQTYDDMLPFIKENHNLCLEYTDLWGRINSVIKSNL